jgi:hypothetical protein
MTTQVPDDEAEVLLAVCRTTYCRIMARSGGDIAAAKMAVRFELARAGFEVISDDGDITAGIATVVVMLADGRYVQRDAIGGWHVHWHPMDEDYDWWHDPHRFLEQEP